MKIKEIQVFEYDELSEDAKEKALIEHNENNDYYFLEEDLSEYLKQLLEENGIKSDDVKLEYDLSYCQGDGVNFEGNFEYKNINFDIKDNCINYFMDNDENDALKIDFIDAIYTEFKEVYKEICDKIKKSGYSQIEYELSEENFKEICDANEWTFRENGKLEN